MCELDLENARPQRFALFTRVLYVWMCVNVCVGVGAINT